MLQFTFDNSHVEFSMTFKAKGFYDPNTIFILGNQGNYFC